MKPPVALGLAALSLAGWASSAESPGPDFAPMIGRIQEWIDNGYYSGAALLIAKDGVIAIERSFGDFTPETETYIASAGKWLATAAIAAVVDDGKLSWDDPASKWIPALADAKGAATLRQLLSHTAGYPAYQPEDRPRDTYQTLSESVEHLTPLTAEARPGQKFEYGGLAMQVAGRMAELAAGQDWESLFQEKIAHPLGMTATRFTPVDTKAGGHAPMLGGGARSTLRDYARFLEMIANDGVFRGRRVLSKFAIAEMQADQVLSAGVRPGEEFVERARGATHTGIYGLGEWREEIDANGAATLLSSPGWAGTYPWIDKATGIRGIFIAHVTPEGQAAGFDSFLASPVLAPLARAILRDTRAAKSQ